MVIFGPKSTNPLANQLISFVKLQQLKFHFKRFTFIYWVLFIQCKHLKFNDEKLAQKWISFYVCVRFVFAIVPILLILIRMKNVLMFRMCVCVCFFFSADKMPSLPQAAFAVCKIREQKSKPSRNQGGSNGSHSGLNNQNVMEYLPVKYNEKFMNAIWGHYNRYSPHNIKSNDAALAISSNGKMLMSAAAAAAAASVQQQSFFLDTHLH